MHIPLEPLVFGIKINIHLILEYFAFFVAFRYYVILRRKSPDKIPDKNRLSIIVGATFGALIGSRLFGYFENPVQISLYLKDFIELLNTKTIMGGLFGGLIGVEISKKLIGEKKSSGDLFTFPIIIGIIIGRIGCFLSGTHEFTYGKTTSFFMGMNLGDGFMRHPIALYEIIFLFLLILFLRKIRFYTQKNDGLQFKVFMISYFGFRFLIEFIKPNEFFIFGLSSIQWLCILCWLYYLPAIKKLTKDAGKKIYLLRLHH